VPARAAAVSGPDRQRALELYRGGAAGYDPSLSRAVERYRERAIERLWLAPGDAVLDVACGTGASFPMLAERVGPTGRIVGVDLSPDMLAIVTEHVRGLGLGNVIVIEGAVEEAELPDGLDAALFSLTHDVLQSKPALDNVFAHLRRGGRVAAFGAKWAARWNLPVNFYVRRLARRYVTTFAGFEAPWRHLAEYLDSLTVDQVGLGGAYIASGIASGRPSSTR
jgi:ubiquinone/menaquinone biosynthesis C-methylase UbiE